MTASEIAVFILIVLSLAVAVYGIARVRDSATGRSGDPKIYTGVDFGKGDDKTVIYYCRKTPDGKVEFLDPDQREGLPW
ncbi:MAG: hypothetical protein V3T30_04875 [Thermodesulfobacteriota bacterium]